MPISPVVAKDSRDQPIHLIQREYFGKAIAQLMLKACKAANVFAREATNIARLTIVPGDEIMPGHLTIGATSAETGDNAGELEANIPGNPIEIAFNVKYLIDVLSVVGGHLITLETSAASSPGVIRPVGDDAFTHVIMPMHVGGR